MARERFPRSVYSQGRDPDARFTLANRHSRALSDNSAVMPVTCSSSAFSIQPAGTSSGRNREPADPAR